jgi:hypothetical protein
MFYERRENIRMMEEMRRRAMQEPQEERHAVSDLELLTKMKIDPQAR